MRPRRNHKADMRERVAFFHAHAGWSYDPKTETAEEGRARCARELARAELIGALLHVDYTWSIDEDCTSAEFSDEYPPYECWVLVAETCGASWSLGGIDLGRDRTPLDCPDYKRVVEAELARDLIEELHRHADHLEHRAARVREQLREAETDAAHIVEDAQ